MVLLNITSYAMPSRTESLNPLSHEKCDWILDISSPRGWWGSGTGRCSKPDWMGLWATGAGGMCPCPMAGGWDWVISKAPFNTNHSVILWPLDQFKSFKWLNFLHDRKLFQIILMTIIPSGFPDSGELTKEAVMSNVMEKTIRPIC